MRTVVFSIALVLGFGAVVSPAMGQGSAGSANEAATAELQEVVVTAEKRESTVQKTPISITAISGVELQESGVSDLRLIAVETPGLSMRTSGPGQTEFEMRGLTSTGGFSPTVGFYMDETPVTAPAQAVQGKVVIDPDLFDLNRVEVLRGPQGTLYGSGSMGGTIKLVTNAPQLNTFAVSGETAESSTEGGGFNYGGNAMLNLPIGSDLAAVRFVGTYKYVSGWIDRIVLNPFPLETNGGLSRGNVLAAPVQATLTDQNWERLAGGRVSALFKIGDRLTITPAAMYQKITQGGGNTIDNPPGDVYAHYQPFDVAEPSEDDFKLYSLSIHYHFDPFDLTSATSKWNRQDMQTQDIAETMQALFGFPDYYVSDGGVGPGAQHITDWSSQTSEEIRLASNGTGRLQWLGGLFYSDYRSNTRSQSFYAGFANIFGTDDLINADEPLEIKQRALFGEVSYQATAQLKATLGLRYYEFTSEQTSHNSGLASIAAGPGVVILTGSARNSGFNPKVTLSYTPTQDVLVYTTAAKGFRPGGPNVPVPLSGPVQCLTGPGNLESLGLTSAPSQFNPDSLWSYEIGEKARTLEGRLQINSDVYYESWTAVQQLVVPSCGFPFTANAGSASVYGSEIELAASLPSAFTVTESIGLTHATFSESVQATDTVKGQRLLDVPDFTSTTSLIFRKPVSSDLSLIIRGTYTYTGNMQDITYVRNTLAGYSLARARAGVEGGNWSAYLFCDNLANKFAILTNSAATTVNIPQFNRQVTAQPRTIGVEFQFHY